MNQETKKPLDEQRRMVAYLDGLQAKFNALRELQSPEGDASQSASGEELSSSLRFGDSSQSAFMPSISALRQLKELD